LASKPFVILLFFIFLAGLATGLGACSTAAPGVALTPQAECVRAGGVWMTAGCEHAAGGGGM
jgi:hypothetical protein